MPSTPATSVRPRDVVQALRAHPWRLVLPVVVMTLSALAAAILRPATWEASQALIVRDEAAGSRLTRPGKFDRAEEMKSVQETILELAHSRGVLEQALMDVGPSADAATKDPWPAPRDIEDLQEASKIAPPKGSEFGKTEVFYLKVQANSKTRAAALTAAISKHLQARYEDLRKSRRHKA